MIPIHMPPMILLCPEPSKDPGGAELLAALDACRRAGATVRIVERDALEVPDAIADEHADPEAFRRRVDMDNLMREMAVHPHDFGKIAEVADPFADIGLPELTGWAGEAKSNRAQRRREARRLAKVRR